ncbi:hypothetical protein MH117_21330 [Paenibacillus sp. ACRRX]|uniref:hypothetical protein n=1 Tax=Paenibacillus sp. ACRRX TaxID=2918206 RepID=UPI001EF5E2C9|nr:hypothetical protein [Paenibacillus sp. ACRRX]MCG7409956.1 hypothetical protein [Paenibacillus sp. ACRRX]
MNGKVDDVEKDGIVHVLERLTEHGTGAEGCKWISRRPVTGTSASLLVLYQT